jgi:ribose/xylose/arabinose/galactoside ABC-type transport system permease subunit
MNKRSARASLFVLAFDNLTWFLLLVSLVVMLFLSNSFFSWTNMLNLAQNSTLLGMLVIAETLVLIIGKIDISIETTMAFSALVGALAAKTGVAPAFAIFVCLAVGAGIGMVNGFSIVYLGTDPFMQTLAMNIVFRGLMLVCTEGLTIFRLPEGYRIFGDTSVFFVPTPIMLLLALYAIFGYILEKTRWGRKLYLLGENQVAAVYSGINVRRISFGAFLIAGILSAFAGLVASTRINSVHNALGNGIVFEVMAAAVMGGISLQGGRGRLAGAFGGVLFLGCVTSILTWMRVDAYAVQTVRGCVILFALLIDAAQLNLRDRYAIT